MKLHELQEARAAAVAEMRALSDTAERESRDLSADEGAKFDGLKGKISGLDTKIARAQALAECERAAPAIVSRVGDGQYTERAAEFSVSKAIRAALGSIEDVGFEREISAEVTRRSGRTFQGIAIPDECFLAERRTLTTSGGAADLIPNVHRPDLFIDRLRSALVVQRLGATVLSDLVGTVDVPRQTGSSTAQWVAEDGSLTETDAAFDDITLSPRTVGALTSYSRRTLLNSSPSIEQIVRNDLANVIASAIDQKAMLGDGSANTPTGIIATSGVAEINLSAGATWEKILSFIAEIQNADADTGALGWAFNATVAKKLRSTLKVTADAGAGFIMDAPNQLAGYAVAMTSAIANDGGSPPAEKMIFGNWRDLIVGYWSGVDLLINPYAETAYAKGRVMVRALRDCDVQVRHAESFAFADNLPQ